MSNDLHTQPLYPRPSTVWAIEFLFSMDGVDVWIEPIDSVFLADNNITILLHSDGKMWWIDPELKNAPPPFMRNITPEFKSTLKVFHLLRQ